MAARKPKLTHTDSKDPPAVAPRMKLSPSLRRSMDIEYFKPGAVLVRQGEATQRLFLVASGNVRVLLGAGSEARTIARLGRGAWIGETALLTGSVSSTTVVAEDEVRVLAISQHDFLAASEADPSIFREIARELAQRLRSADQIIDRAHAHRLVAVRHQQAHAGHAGQVAAACARWAPVPYLAVALDEAAQGGPTVRDYVLEPARLSMLESQVNASEPVTIAHGGASGEDLSEFLRVVARFAGLVLLNGENVPAHVVERLTEIVSLGSARDDADRGGLPDGIPHQRIAIDQRFDPERVARLVCRRRIGLALGGGGARGFAHIGVLRAIAAAGIPIDVVTGTSIGGAVAAGVAAGRSVDVIADAIAAAGRGAMMPSLPPLFSVFSGMFIEWELKRQFGDLQFEDLALPLGIVAVDLLAGDEVTFTSGPLVPAIMASMAVPGIFSPVRHEGRLLADGALRSPVPVRSCRGLGADIVIASHIRVAPPVGGRASSRLPWMPETMALALDVMQEHIAAESAGGADIHVETVIPREHGGLFDFGRRLSIEAAGERAASIAFDGVTPDTLRFAARRGERRLSNQLQDAA